MTAGVPSFQTFAAGNLPGGSVEDLRGKGAVVQRLSLSIIMGVLAIGLSVCIPAIAEEEWGERRMRETLMAAGWDARVAEALARGANGANGAVSSGGRAPGSREAVAEQVGGSRIIAVFDHDGTIMHGDISEGDGRGQPGFLRDLLLQGRLTPEGRAQIPPAAAGDPWAWYRDLVGRDTREAYRWLPTILAGQDARTIEAMAEEAYDRVYQRYLFPEVTRLITVLQEAGAEVYVISASAWPLVRAAARHTGVPRERIFGMPIDVGPDGIFRSNVTKPYTFGAGKTALILERIRLGPKDRLLVIGDSERTDGHMLRFAVRQGGVAVLVNPPPGRREKLEAAGILCQELASRDRFR